MKDLLNKIKKLREKTVTAACRTPVGIEWTSVKISQEGHESLHQDQMQMDLPMDIPIESLDDVNIPNLSEHLKGEVTVALRASELLMRTLDVPTADPQEISDMVEFQVDKISPFPIDQLAISHETLQTSEDSARILIASARRNRIDAIGSTFAKHGTRIHSIDARVLGWLQLLQDGDKLDGGACEILVISDGIDFILAVLHDGNPLIFRPLEANLDDMNVVDELTQEIGYTLTMLDAEHDLPEPEELAVWTIETIPSALASKLQEKSGLKVNCNSLHDLPPLSEGILHRTISPENRIELIPTEWIEQENNRKMRKQFAIISGSIAAIWLSILLIFLTVFKVRDIKLAGYQKEYNAISPLALQARQNQEKLEKLKDSSDRTYSSLECLREATRLLPAGDIEFASYNYSKEKGVTLRGTGRDKSIVTDFFTTLNKSDLFDGVRNESVTDKTTKGVRRAVFSVTLPIADRGSES